MQAFNSVGEAVFFVGVCFAVVAMIVALPSFLCIYFKV
jgi:hypothetical protein